VHRDLKQLEGTLVDIATNLLYARIVLSLYMHQSGLDSVIDVRETSCVTAEGISIMEFHTMLLSIDVEKPIGYY